VDLWEHLKDVVVYSVREVLGFDALCFFVANFILFFSVIKIGVFRFFMMLSFCGDFLRIFFC
jgi:hypothetical protein